MRQTAEAAQLIAITAVKFLAHLVLRLGAGEGIESPEAKARWAPAATAKAIKSQHVARVSAHSPS